MAAKTLSGRRAAVPRRGTRRRSTSPRTHAAGAPLRPSAMWYWAAYMHCRAATLTFCLLSHRLVAHLQQLSGFAGSAPRRAQRGLCLEATSWQGQQCSGWTSPQACTALLPGDSENLTSVQRLLHRAAMLYLVFFAGLCGGFVAAQQLYLWTESARVQSAALAVRPVLPGPRAVQLAQPEACSHHAPMHQR